MADTRGQKRNRETPAGGPQVVSTHNVTFHSYSARVKPDGAFEWVKPHGWIKKVRDTDVIRIQCVRANMKLTHEYLVNFRNNQIGLDLYLKNAFGNGEWRGWRAKLELPPGNYESRQEAEEAVTGSFLRAFENALNRANLQVDPNTGTSFRKYDDSFGTPFGPSRTGAIRAEVAMAEGRTTRFSYQENTDEQHLTYEHRIQLNDPDPNTSGQQSRYRNKIFTERDFPNIMDRTGAAPVNWIAAEPRQKSDTEAANSGPTSRLLFIVDSVLEGTALDSTTDMAVEFVSFNDSPQSVQVWGARFNKDVPGFSGNTLDLGSPLSDPRQFNRGSLTVVRTAKVDGSAIFSVLGHSPNRFFLKPDHHYYLRLEDISNPNLETPFLNEGHSTDFVGQSTPSSIIGQLNVGERGDFATYDQNADSGADHSNGFFILPATHAVERIKIKIVDEAGSIILPEGNQQNDKGVIPLDLMLRFDVIRHPDNERSANTQVQSETVATQPHQWTIPGTIDAEETLKTQRIM